MRPIPVAAGFQPCRPGSVSRAANPGSSAIAKRDTLRAMPLAVTDLTNSRREILIGPRLLLPERLALRLRHYPCWSSGKIGERLGSRSPRDQRRPLMRREGPPPAPPQPQGA